MEQPVPFKKPRRVLVDALSFYRVGHWCLRHRLPIVPRLFQAMGLVLCNASIQPSAEIGAGTVVAFRGLGVIIQGYARIGSYVMIGPHVLIGSRDPYKGGIPVIGDDVYIGAGAKILGHLTVGDGAVIGANAVVLDDIPPHCAAAGIPAHIVRRDVGDWAYGRLRR